MGTTTADLTRRVSYRPLLKPTLYALPILFGGLAVKAAFVASGDPGLAIASLAVVMAGYLASSAAIIRLMEGPDQR
jgi:hypothetical protein